MPPELRALLDKLLSDIALESAAMEASRKSIDDWQQAIAQDLLVFFYAAYGVGKGDSRFTPQEQAMINKLVGEQLDYLNRFASQLDIGGWKAKDAARAALYAGSIKPAYWRGRTLGYDLPAYPGDGSTPCRVNCRCHVEIDELDSENMDADFYWRLGATEHCSLCVERSQQWTPLKFRGGELA